MGGIIEIIFGNIFILVAILVGLLSLFQRGEQNRDDQGPVRNDQTRERMEQRSEEIQGQAKEKAEEVVTHGGNEWYEAMKDSRERLDESEGQQLKDSIQSEAIGGTDLIKQGSLSEKDLPKVSRISVAKNINRKRIVESVVMSEILGKPKSKQKKSV
ncbi:hypothetical protein [Halalkalibacillus halophilus]|uniref:hypothetical protein n=1 Tax=Halalkalibacillus halophilus TaxID=392827 RepID=UPI000427020B|nr:hypothetical protein [Halalkalibacillus halophilus]